MTLERAMLSDGIVGLTFGERGLEIQFSRQRRGEWENVNVRSFDVGTVRKALDRFEAVGADEGLLTALVEKARKLKAERAAKVDSGKGA